MESISTASEGIATQTDMALPWKAKQAALLKIQEDHIGQQIIRQRMA